MDVHEGVHRGVPLATIEVHSVWRACGGVQRGVQKCTEVHPEVYMEVNRGMCGGV